MLRKNDELLSTRSSSWRLNTDEQGVHRWMYLTQEDEAQSQRPQTRAEKYFVGLPTDAPNLPVPSSFDEAARNGLSFYEQLQLDDGHWACSYGGPCFLLPGIVFALYITQSQISEEWAIEMMKYICHHQNKDGGWGLHTAGPTTVFATVLYYVALRILGMAKDDRRAVKACERLLYLGGALQAPQWARYWLALLNLFEWDGVQPVPSEMWYVLIKDPFNLKSRISDQTRILPTWLPFHPSRWWVQCRSVYLPVSLLYSNKYQMELNDLLIQIRREIHPYPYDSIQFASYANSAGPLERRRPLSLFLTIANPVALFWERFIRPVWIHSQANDAIRKLIRREDENTAYNDIAPVNKAFHMVAVYFYDGPGSESVKRHQDKILPYLWKGAEGMNCGGTNGTQFWDTAFSVIGIAEAGLAEEPQFRTTLQKAHKFIKASQLQENLADPFRQGRKGGWPFSTKDNGYIVSDCAAEGLKATLLLQEKYGFEQLIASSSLFDCVDTLLNMQNSDGGFPSYERARAGTFVEWFNPAETFDRCMVDYSYPECTTAVASALALFRKYYPSYLADKIDLTIRSAAAFLARSQRSDGSWYGSWGICFTYGTMFGLEGLAASGQDYATSEPVRRACKFLVGKQRDDGGWGEHWQSCERGEYVEHEQSQVVNTAWATLGLMAAGYPDTMVVARGLELIRQRQQANGEWLQEAVEGIFNATCTIECPNYKFHFSIRALGRFKYEYLPGLANRGQHALD